MKIKGIRKKILIVIFIICAIHLGRGLYWYYYLDGINTNVIISTQYSLLPSAVEVYIDSELYYRNDSLQALYEYTEGICLSCGFHHLKVVVDGTEEYAGSFVVFPVRWVYIQIQKHRENYKDDENWFHVEYSFDRIGLM